MSRDELQRRLPAKLSEQFEVIRPLGSGGFGSVLLARDRSLGRQVAIKMGHAPDREDHTQRFRREAEGLAQLTHPNVVRLYDFGVLPEGPYLVLEYLEGKSPGRAEGQPDPVTCMLQVADALEAVHAAGALHRDVKPSNVVVTEDGRAVLIDFGLFKDPERTAMTRSGAVVGTVKCMPPEVAAGEAWSPAGDWFSWGATLYMLLEGRNPFTPPQLVRMVSMGDVAPEFREVPEDSPLRTLLGRCLSAEPVRRPTTRAEIEDLLAGKPPPPTGKLRVRKPGSRRTPWLLGLGGLGALMLLVWSLRGPTPVPVVTTEPAAPVPVETGPLEELGPGDRGWDLVRNRKDGSLLVRVPAGSYLDRAPEQSRTEPGPATEVRVESFLIGRHEVSVSRYERFLAETGYRDPPRWELQRQQPELPVIFVTWRDAAAYCSWAGGRLPTSREWGLAAGGREGFTYPWGAEGPPPDEGRANIAYDPARRGGIIPRLSNQWTGALLPVDALPAGESPFGLRHALGNVWEWCADTATLPEGSLFKAVQKTRIARGSSWSAETAKSKLHFWRVWDEELWQADNVGFRLARDDPR